MKVYRLTIMVVDFDDIGGQAVSDVLESTSYPNRCISPGVIDIDEREVEWTDYHPLNNTKKRNAEFRRLFG